MKTKFDFYDYFIFVLVLLISIGIGLYFGFNLNEKLKRFIRALFKPPKVEAIVPNEITTNKSDELINSPDLIKNDHETESIRIEENKTMEYLTGNKSMSAIPIALSLLATFFSSSSLLGFPAEVYQYGIQYWIMLCGVWIVPLIGGIFI